MNRRSFLAALGLAPVAAALGVPPSVKPTFADGGLLPLRHGRMSIYAGEYGPEAIMPLNRPLKLELAANEGYEAFEAAVSQASAPMKRFEPRQPDMWPGAFSAI